MKPQFTTRTLLLGTAFAAICLAGFLGVRSVLNSGNVEFRLNVFLMVVSSEAWLWLPFVALAFAIGRRSISAQMLIALALCEAAPIAYLWWRIHR